MLYYRAVITRGVITGIYLHTYYMIHVVTKVGSARGVPASDSDEGAERTGGSIPVELAWVPDGPLLLLCGGATGQVETT